MKILVTTDFSENSKGAIRFVQSLAKQSNNVAVIFYHAIQIMKPLRWNDIFFKSFKEEEIQRLTTDLEKFIYTTVDKEKDKFISVKFVIDDSSATAKDIELFAENNSVDFICLATQGAGMLRKVIGTHTSHIVNNSKVPVMVIPSHYISKPLNKATYLSDFENLKEEVNVLSPLLSAISLQLEVLHYSSVVIDKEKLEKNKALFHTKEFMNMNLDIQESNFEISLVDRITRYVQDSKPELLIMFTKRDKGFFESVFLPSKSAELTYTTKVPVLIFSK